ncbi:hypothetical protein IMX26_04305 [Clostridium sp. 'deep sea']|uniref:M1 family aminopeptidase n=1 Tax=Clostridium sp. 'deep sea' TaxID=2779445 RepID=UPI001896A15A|nr:M1 family aminopeptidase [Clostridium sp. 'deep sea']QOR36043.1 hypothetical protein IMX26_04305 [Clostridium sp. 'deep sea']
METLINVNFNVQKKSYTANMKILHCKHIIDMDSFIIHKNITIKKLLVNNIAVTWQYSNSTISYMPEGKTLTLNINPNLINKSLNTVEFDFEGHISLTEYDLNRISNSFIELNLYSPWYPVIKDFNQSKTTITVKGLQDYFIIKGNKKNDVWNIAINDFDSYIIGYNNPIIKTVNTKFCTVNIVAAKNSNILMLSKNMIGEVLNYCNNTLKSSISDAILDIAVVPRTNGGGYCRRNLIVSPEDNYQNNEWKFDMFLLHEVSHLWFTGANTNSWEDWLNESFAEYISLLYIEQKYGKKYYNFKIDNYIEITKDCAAIKGSNRHSKEGAKIRYKGTLLLHNLRKQFGIDVIKDVFNILIKLPTKTTDNLIKKLNYYNNKVASFITSGIK